MEKEESFQVTFPAHGNGEYHILITFTHYTKPSTLLRHPKLRKQRRGTLCLIRVYGLHVDYEGVAFLNPHDVAGFSEKIGRRVSLKNVLLYGPFVNKDFRRAIWDAFLACYENMYVPTLE